MSLFSTFSQRTNLHGMKTATSTDTFSTMDKVYMIHGEILMQSVWIARVERGEAKIASDIERWNFDDFNSPEINANSSHGLHRMANAINLTARIYYNIH